MLPSLGRACFIWLGLTPPMGEPTLVLAGGMPWPMTVGGARLRDCAPPIKAVPVFAPGTLEAMIALRYAAVCLGKSRVASLLELARGYVMSFAPQEASNSTTHFCMRAIQGRTSSSNR